MLDLFVTELRLGVPGRPEIGEETLLVDAHFFLSEGEREDGVRREDCAFASVSFVRRMDVPFRDRLEMELGSEKH